MGISDIFSLNQRVLFVNFCLFLSSLFLLSFTFYLQAEATNDVALSKKIVRVLTIILYHSLMKSSTLFIIGLLLAIVVLLLILITLMTDTKATKKTTVGKPSLHTELAAKWKGQTRQRQKLSEGEATVVNLLLKYFFGKLIYEKQERLVEGIIHHMNTDFELPSFIGDLEIRELKFGEEIIHLDYANAREYDVEIDYVEYLTELANQGIEESHQSLKSEEGCGKGLELDIDISYFDPDIIIKLFARVWVDFPITQLLSIPIEGSLEKIGFDLKLRVRIDDLWNRMWVSFREKPLYHFVLGNAIGEKPLKNLPIVSQLINKQLDSILSQFIFPKEIEVPLPSTFSNIQKESLVTLLVKEKSGRDDLLHKMELDSSSEKSTQKSDLKQRKPPQSLPRDLSTMMKHQKYQESSSNVVASDFKQKKRD